MFVNLIDYWALWLPLIVVISLHLLEKSQSQAGVIYPKNMPELMRKRIQIFSFQTKEQFEECHIKGSRHIDITEIDPDALLMLIEKKYPVLCYGNDGVQSHRYFEHIHNLQKSFWLAGGLNQAAEKIEKYCIWRTNYD